MGDFLIIAYIAIGLGVGATWPVWLMLWIWG